MLGFLIRMARLFIAKIIGTLGTVPDTTPDAFVFTDATNVALGSAQISNTITVAGLGTGQSAVMTVSGGVYYKNGGSAAATSTTVVNGDMVAVGHTASSSNSTAVNTTLTIGGVSDTFTSTTLAFSGSATLDSTLSTPILIDKTSGGTIAFDVGLDPDYAVGDTVYLVAKSKAGAVVLTFSHTITLAEATDTSAGTTGKAIFTGLSAVSLSSTYRWTAYVLKGGGATYGPSSATVITGPDDIAPVLSNPTKSSIGSTTATVGVDTDTGEGQIWLVLPATNVQPSNTQIKAGQDSAGAAAAFATTINPVTASGTLTANATGLTLGNTYYPFWLHRDAAGNETVLPGLSLTTVATSGWATTTGYALTNGGKTANPDNGGGGNPDILGTGVVSSGTKTLIMTADFPAGYTCVPGIKDTGSGVSMLWNSNGSGDFPYGWETTNPRHAALKLVCDFTARTIAAYIDGTLKGTIAMPTGLVNVRALGNMQFGTAPSITLDTSNWI